MAELFSVLSSGADVELVGLDNLVDVQQTMVIAKPSGVIFPVRVPSAGAIAGPTSQLANAMASAFNQAAEVPGILSMAVTQDIDAAGNLIDVVIMTVASTNGLVTAEKTVPLALFGQSSLSLAVPTLSTRGSRGGERSFEVIEPQATTSGAVRSTFSRDAFAARVSSWQSDLDALADL